VRGRRLCLDDRLQRCEVGLYTSLDGTPQERCDEIDR
jgi:hypothetical protein